MGTTMVKNAPQKKPKMTEKTKSSARLWARVQMIKQEIPEMDIVKNKARMRPKRSPATPITIRPRALRPEMMLRRLADMDGETWRELA